MSYRLNLLYSYCKNHDVPKMLVPKSSRYPRDKAEPAWKWYESQRNVGGNVSLRLWKCLDSGKEPYRTIFNHDSSYGRPQDGSVGGTGARRHAIALGNFWSRVKSRIRVYMFSFFDQSLHFFHCCFSYENKFEPWLVQLSGLSVGL